MWQIRELGAGDAQEVYAIGAIELPSEIWSAKSIEESCDLSQQISYVAETDDRVIGFIQASEVCGEVSMYNIAVAQEHKNKGVGTKLVQQLIVECERKKHSSITLEVRKSNDVAKQFYEKIGFENMGERPKFYTNPTESGCIYTLKLKPI